MIVRMKPQPRQAGLGKLLGRWPNGTYFRKRSSQNDIRAPPSMANKLSVVSNSAQRQTQSVLQTTCWQRQAEETGGHCCRKKTANDLKPDGSTRGAGMECESRRE